MKSVFENDRIAILSKIVHMNQHVLVPVLAIALVVGTVSTSIVVSNLHASTYSKTNTQTPVAKVKAPAVVAAISTDSPVVAPTAKTAVPSGAPKVKTSKPSVAQASAGSSVSPSVATPPAAPVAIAQPLDFSIKNGASSGFPIAANVALEASLSFKPGYDNSQTVIITFAAPLGYICPPVSILPYTTDQVAPFTCYLPENFTLGHKAIIMTATNGKGTVTATYDLNLTSIHGN